jgi:hypothetical protein
MPHRLRAKDMAAMCCGSNFPVIWPAFTCIYRPALDRT